MTGTADGSHAVTATPPQGTPLNGPRTGEPDPHGLGASLPSLDAPAKAEGTFAYAADLWAEGLLWAAILRSPHPHARIVSVDTEQAAALPGVRAVLTHEDVPGDAAHGRGIADRPAFARDVVRHHGEPIAAVAADHPDTARLAAATIAVEYEVLEPLTDPEQAFEAEPLHPDGNVIRHIPLRFGDPEAVGEVVVEGLYRIGRQDPAPIGAEAGLAVPRPDGGVEIYTASTDPHADRDLAAACFGLPPEQVKLVVTGVPGAMGDREDTGMQVPLGLLALRTGCPVKLAAGREESFLGHTHRHPTLLRYRHHATAEGRLVKVEAQILLDAGAYADTSADALAAAVSFAAGPYVVPHATVDGWAVRTNNPPSGHLRGEGAMQVCAAYEGQMDKLAATLGVDPTELRLRNALATGDLLPTGQAVTCPAPVAELLQAVREAPLPAAPGEDSAGWLLPGGPEGAGEPGAVRRGVGYGLGMVHMLGAEGADEVSTATVKVDGPVATVLCAAVETGQGFATLARQIVQEVLGIDEVHVASVDTDQPPAGAGAHSRHTWVSGGAVERAAKMVRTQLLQPLAAKFGMSTELLEIADGKITSYDGVLSTTVAEALDGKELWATAQCRPHPTEPLDETTGQGDAFVGLAFAAVRAVVDVDVELGSVRVVEMAVAQDVGRVLNPRQLRARIEAGVTQGVGAALTEHLRVAKGVVRHPDFTGYSLPTALDAPDIRIVKLIEERDVVAPFGAKAASAVPVVVSPAAVASAVRAATGRPVNRLPIRPQAAAVAPS